MNRMCRSYRSKVPFMAEEMKKMVNTAPKRKQNGARFITPSISETNAVRKQLLYVFN